jgi:hypothetical protein
MKNSMEVPKDIKSTTMILRNLSAEYIYPKEAKSLPKEISAPICIEALVTIAKM